MDNKYKMPLVFFLIGMAITIVGALFKIMHWSFANELLTLGMTAEVIAILVVVYKLLKSK